MYYTKLHRKTVDKAHLSLKFISSAGYGLT